jgi:hypothetical protein
MRRENAQVKGKVKEAVLLHFPRVPLAEANKRSGKHYKIVADVLSDLKHIDEYSALKIDLASAGKKKADLRAALHRAAKKNKISLVTTSDAKYLYVFRLPCKSTSGIEESKS